MSNLPWFRYYSEVAGDKKFGKIARTLGTSKAEVVGAWSLLLCAASDSPERGKLYVTFQERYTIDDVTDLLCFDKRKTQQYLLAFIRMEMVGCKFGVFYIVNWDERQHFSDSSTERVRKYREKHAPQRSSNVPVTPPDIRDQNTDTDINRIGEESADPFTNMQHMCEQLTGRLAVQGDIPTLNKFVKEGVIQSDIAGAIAWRVENHIKPVTSIAQLEGGVLTNKAQRIQAATAASAPKPNGHARQPSADVPTSQLKGRALIQRLKEESTAREAANNG